MSAYAVIDRNGEPLETDVVLHPGSVLDEELEERGIIKKDFAALLNIKPSNLSELLKGKRHVSARLALKLERYLDIDAAYWLRAQMAYDLAMARKEMAAATEE